MFIVLACFAFLGGALLVLVSGVWMNEKMTNLEENTQNIASNTRELLTSNYAIRSGKNAVMMICNNLDQLSEAVDADFFIVNESGKVVYCKDMMDSNYYYGSSCILHSSYEIPENILEPLTEGKRYRNINNMGGYLNEQNFIVASPITSEGVFRGAIFAVQPVASGLLPYVSTILRMFAYASLFAFAIAFAFIYNNTYKMVKPLLEMNEAAKQYSNGDFSKRITIRKKKGKRNNRTEIDELAESFNSMAQALSVLEMSRRDFISNVSHELKTPMTTISGFIDGILDGTIAKEDQDKYLQIISDDVKRLSRLVTGMLNMNKIEAGKIDINPVKFDISEMIFNTLLSFEQIIEKKNADVRGLDNFGVNMVYADKDMINQVVYNLIDNAVKFTPEGGYIEVSSKSDNEKAIIRIKNSGKGIPPEERSKIFERFYKVDKSRSYDVKGAGMGLYIVKTLIELHGGHITVQSVENEYTEFIFTLPIL
jgi:signal transduction histidine kinase